MLLVSRCLVGFPCNYNGESRTDERVSELFQEGKAIAVCPEQEGGLPTPRPPAEIYNSHIFNIDGDDVTEAFTRGAHVALSLAKEYGCTLAVLKAHSPSCGCGKVYDGTFTGTLVEGDGVCAALLKEHGIEVYTEEDFPF